MLAVFIVIFLFCSSSKKSSTLADPTIVGASNPEPAKSESASVVFPWSICAIIPIFRIASLSPINCTICSICLNRGIGY